VKRTAKEVLKEEVNAIKAIPLTGVDDAVEEIMKCKGKLVLIGMGKAGIIARKVAATFASTGTPAFFLHPSEAQHGDLGMVSEGDLMIAYSNSGRTREIIESTHLAKQLCDLKLITVTSNTESPLALQSDIVIETGGYPEVCPLGMAPTCSTTAMLVIGDVLAMVVMEQKEFTKEEYAKRHHGGYLGQKARGETDEA
jgi:arabinose-5-phosphate isomerase